MEQVEPILLKLNHQNLSIISDSIDRKRMAWFGISFASMGVRRGAGCLSAVQWCVPIKLHKNVNKWGRVPLFGNILNTIKCKGWLNIQWEFCKSMEDDSRTTSGTYKVKVCQFYVSYYMDIHRDTKTHTDTYRHIQA